MAKKDWLRKNMQNTGLPGAEPAKKEEIKPAAEVKPVAPAEKKAEPVKKEEPKKEEPVREEVKKEVTAITPAPAPVEAAPAADDVSSAKKKRGRPAKKDRKYNGVGQPMMELSFPLEENLHKYLEVMQGLSEEGSKRAYVKRLIIEDYNKNRETYEQFLRFTKKLEKA